jgi:hypothetical protein
LWRLVLHRIPLRILQQRTGQLMEEPITDILKDVINALEQIRKALISIDDRIWKLENE